MKKPIALGFTNHVVHWTMLGLQFGYPECCVGEFVIHAVKGTYETRGTRKLNGTGYVPCIKCNELPEEQLIATIESRRMPHVKEPFSKSIKVKKIS